MAHRREIWIADLGKNTLARGSVQSGIRPVIILSNERNNRHSTVVAVVPLTSRDKKPELPTHVKVSKIHTNYTLMEDSVAVLEMRMPLDVRNLKRKIGYVYDDEVMEAILVADQIQVSELE